MPTHRWGRAHPRSSVLSCLTALALIVPHSTLAASRVVIGEVNWAGSSLSTADEWVELWNLGSEEQSLDGWRLEGASTKPITFIPSQTIAAQQALLVANYDETNTKSVLNVHPAIVTTDVALGNDALMLRLIDNQGILVDQAGDGKKPAAGSTKPVTAMVRIDPLTDGSSASAWTSASTTSGLDADVVDRGSPGLCDGCSGETSSTIETTSSTAFLILNQATSTTNTVPTTTSIIVETASSSTVVTSTAVLVAALTTTSTEAAATTTSLMQPPPPLTIVTATTAPASASPIQITMCRARLEEVFPAPDNGPEWIEISGCDTPTSMIGWSIHDAQTLILRITALTTIEESDEGRLRILLPGQHLNNGGDTVILRGPDTGIYDLITYPALKHDEHYVRHADNTWWIPERTPMVTTSQMTPAATTALIPKFVALSTQPATVATEPLSPRRMIDTTSVTSMTLEEYRLSTPRSPRLVKYPYPKSPPKKQIPRTHRMTTHSSIAQAPNVLLHGIVGTPPNLIAKRTFILLNATGEGLLVHLNGHQPSPKLAARIDVTGSLMTNDEGTHLEMHTKDSWQPSSRKIQDPTPQPLDAPSVNPETMWSLVDVTGRVTERSGNALHLMIDDTEMTVIIPSSLGYRPARIRIGDQVHIIGVLDKRSDIPRLHPRTAHDITLIPAILPPSTTVMDARPHVPPYLPIVSATGMIAAGYGLRRLRTWYEERKLIEQLRTTMGQLSST